jgi:arylsulfatase A-like enzyme
VPEDFLEHYFQPAEEEEEDEAEQVLEPLLDPAPGPLDRGDDRAFLRLRQSYAAAVTLLDTGLGELLEEVGRRGLSEDLVALVTTDHGQALGEHGIVGPCHPWLHEELVHLPLLIRLPGGIEAGRRVPALTQPCDLLPTLAELFGLTPGPVQGQSLVPLLRGQVESVRPHACSALRHSSGEEWALRTLEWAFLLPIATNAEQAPRTPQLYVKPEDRWEVNNVIQHHLDLAEGLERTLRAFVESPAVKENQ